MTTLPRRTLLLLACLPAFVTAHGRLTVPRPRVPVWADPAMEGWTSPTAVHRENEPAFQLAGSKTFDGHTYTPTAYRCKDFASAPPQVTVAAGQDLLLEWTLAATHPGDCSLYISYDEDKVAPEHWLKLAEFPGCVDQALYPTFDGLEPPAVNHWTVRLPDWLPSCDHCVLRWEWYSVQQVVDLEFFTSCSDVTVVGTSESPESMLTKVSQVVAISGTEHLPDTADGYRYAYGGEFGEEFVAGPEVVTYTHSDSDSDSEDGPAATLSASRPPTPSRSPSRSPSPTRSQPSSGDQGSDGAGSCCVASAWHLNAYCPGGEPACVQAKHDWCESVDCHEAYGQFCERSSSCGSDLAPSVAPASPSPVSSPAAPSPIATASMTPSRSPSRSPSPTQSPPSQDDSGAGEGCCVATAWHLNAYCPGSSPACIQTKNDWCEAVNCHHAYEQWCERSTACDSGPEPPPPPPSSQSASRSPSPSPTPSSALVPSPLPSNAAPTPSVAPTAGPSSPSTNEFVRHGYLENWVAMETSALHDLTAVFYGFLTLDKTPQYWDPRVAQWDGDYITETMTGADVMDVMSGNPAHAWHKQKMDEVISYCASNGKRFIWALGGWSDLTLTISDAQIPALVDKIADLLAVAGDGIDLDFEHLSSHTGAVLQQQRLVVGKLIVTLKNKFMSTPGMENKWIVYTPRYNAFFEGGAYGSNLFATDGEGLDVFGYITAHSQYGIDAVDYVNLMMYDINAQEAFSGATQPYFVQSHYDAVVEATSAVVGLSKTVIGFEPRRPQAYTGVWAGMQQDKDTIEHLVSIGAGGAMWWAMNDVQMSDGQTCGQNSVELAAHAAAVAANAGLKKGSSRKFIMPPPPALPMIGGQGPPPPTESFGSIVGTVA